MEKKSTYVPKDIGVSEATVKFNFSFLTLFGIIVLKSPNEFGQLHLY
ncbi:hypothetical protein [Clostridium sp.]